MQEAEIKPRNAVPHGAARYQGRRLAYLLLAMCVPAALLYLRLVLGLAATDTRVTPEQAQWLEKLSLVALLLFFAAQIVSARFLQEFLMPKSAGWKNILQYAGMLIFGLLFSLAGAVTLEGFGMDVFLRVAGVH